MNIIKAIIQAVAMNATQAVSVIEQLGGKINTGHAQTWNPQEVDAAAKDYQTKGVVVGATLSDAFKAGADFAARHVACDAGITLSNVVSTVATVAVDAVAAKATGGNVAAAVAVAKDVATAVEAHSAEHDQEAHSAGPQDESMDGHK